MREIVAEAFVQGMHSGLLVGGIAMLIGAVAAFLFIREKTVDTLDSYSNGLHLR